MTRAGVARVPGHEIKIAVLEGRCQRLEGQPSGGWDPADNAKVYEADTSISEHKQIPYKHLFKG